MIIDMNSRWCWQFVRTVVLNCFIDRSYCTINTILTMGWWHSSIAIHRQQQFPRSIGRRSRLRRCWWRGWSHSHSRSRQSSCNRLPLHLYRKGQTNNNKDILKLYYMVTNGSSRHIHSTNLLYIHTEALSNRYSRYYIETFKMLHSIFLWPLTPFILNF